jgi:SsrA-binding protein
MTTYIQNKKVRLNFEILKTFEAGMSLYGFETKAIRHNRGSLEGSHIIVRGGEAFLVGASITEYQPANTPKKYEKDRPRKLLLNKKELAEIEQQTEKAGLTAVPLRLYNIGSKIKLELAIVRGKKKHDKREALKARDSKRDIERTLKNQ